MKVKAFLIASVFAMSLSLVACGGNTEETPAVDTTTTTEMPATPAVDTAATVAPADTMAVPAADTAAADTSSK